MGARNNLYLKELIMILLGVLLLVLGLIFAFHLLFILGIVLLVIGLVLACFGGAGNPIGPRRHYW